jgi:hypothetical protein
MKAYGARLNSGQYRRASSESSSAKSAKTQRSAAKVVGLHPLGTDQALNWLTERGKVNTSATELAKAWGWSARRAQRQLRSWHTDGRIMRRGRDIAVIGQPLVAPPSATSGATQSDVAATRGDTKSDIPATTTRHDRRVALTLLILAPIAGLNVWPRVTQLLAGTIDASGWAMVAFQILALLMLAQIPFALERTKSWIARVAFVGFAIMLVTINMTFSIEAIGHVRDTTRDHNRAITDNIASLSRQLDERRNERAGLQAFTPVTSEQIADAQKAVDDAVTARDQECGKVGDNCRKRVAELSDRQDKLNSLQSNKAIGDRAAELNANIGALEKQISALGPAPLEQDPMATRIAMLTFGMLSPDEISDALPIVLSLAAEICAFFGPFLFLGGHTQSAWQ